MDPSLFGAFDLKAACIKRQIESRPCLFARLVVALEGAVLVVEGEVEAEGEVAVPQLLGHGGGERGGQEVGGD